MPESEVPLCFNFKMPHLCALTKTTDSKSNRYRYEKSAYIGNWGDKKNQNWGKFGLWRNHHIRKKIQDIFVKPKGSTSVQKFWTNPKTN